MKNQLPLPVFFLLLVVLSFAAKVQSQCPAFAGTYNVGPIVGQSNSSGSGTVFLCYGDSLIIDHNGDYNLSGDPNPATAPGIGWAFYDCPATIGGADLQTILTDPCILPGAINGIWVATGEINGDINLVNNGALQAAFNSGHPVQIFFYPITLDNFEQQSYETAQIGLPPGPCVNVNTQAPLEVVYLNSIHADAIVNNFDGNDCLGKFRLLGGYPEWNNNATYTVDIRLQSDTSVHALVNTNPAYFFHSAEVIFSAPQEGIYEVRVEDGTSCGTVFTVNMQGCDPSDNLGITLPDTLAAAQGAIVCVPVTVNNCSIVGFSLSLQWDPAVFAYDGVQDIHPALQGLDGTILFNTNQTGEGLLGVIYYSAFGNNIDIPDGESLFSLCLESVSGGAAADALVITNYPAPVIFEDALGKMLAVSLFKGQISAVPAIPVLESRIVAWPNPVRPGEPVQIDIPSGTQLLEMRDAQGRLLYRNATNETTVSLDTQSLAPGIYFIRIKGAAGVGLGKLVVN